MIRMTSLVSLGCSLFVAGLIFSSSAEAKRAAPAVVKPIESMGVQYHYIIEYIKTGCKKANGICGMKVSMTATTTRDKKRKWTKELYQVRYNEKLETDVQEVHPRSLKFKGSDSVELIDERDRRFIMKKYDGAMYWPARPRVYEGSR